MKVWVPDYAKRRGACEVEGEIDEINGVTFRTSNWWIAKIGTGAFLTRDEAVAAADVLRAKRIASLRKQIARLDGLVYREDA